MATETKARRQKTPKLTSAQRATAEEALRAKDRDFFGRGLAYAKAAEALSAIVRFKVTAKDIRSMSSSCCKFWKTGAFPLDKAQSRARGFTSCGWHRQIDWIQKHREEIDPKEDTIASVTKRMRSAGLLTNRNGYIEALKAAGVGVAEMPATPVTEAP